MVSSTEACMWACSMDELLWPVDQYKALRDSDADGQVVNGIRWARNRGLHQAIANHRWNGPGLVFTTTFPATFDQFQITWLPRQEMGPATGIDPMKALYWSAVINGVVAVPIMVAMMLLAGNPKVMGALPVRRKTRFLGWGAVVLMAAAVLMMGSDLLR